MPAATKATEPVASAFKYRARPKAFTLAKDAPKVEVLNAEGDDTNSYVTRGTRANGGENAPEHLVHVSGEKMTGVQLSVIAFAIIGGVITDAELDYLVAQRAQARKAA